MLNHKFRIIFACFFVCFISCKQHKNNERELSVFRYNESKGINTLDPAFAKNQTVIWPVNQIFNGLVQLNDSLQVIPCLAKKWDISENGRIYTFILRGDVFFHPFPVNGKDIKRQMVASDVIYSLKRIGDDKIGSPGSWVFGFLDKSKYDRGFERINDSAIRIYLSRPFPPFLGVLSMQYCSVVLPEVVEYYGRDFGFHPVGTGPFYLKYWKDGEKLVLRKNPNYFEKDEQGNKLPYLEAVTISFIADKQSEFMEFIKGNLDFISGVHQTYKDELITRSGKLSPKYASKIKMLTVPYLNTEYLGFLTDTSNPLVKNSPLALKEVRRAIQYGFDREKMMKYLRNNIGTPALQGFIPKGLPSFSEKLQPYFYSPDSSRALLQRAGFANGKGLPEISLMTTSDYLDLCEYIQHELETVGIKLKIEVSTGASFRDMVANGKLVFFRGSWIADYPDAENYLALFYSKNFSPAGPNYFRYSNARFDQLYEESLNCHDFSKRSLLYRSMDSLIMADAVVIPLYYDQVVRFVASNLEGLGNNALNLLNLKKAIKTKTSQN